MALHGTSLVHQTSFPYSNPDFKNEAPVALEMHVDRTFDLAPTAMSKSTRQKDNRQSGEQVCGNSSERIRTCSAQDFYGLPTKLAPGS
jgi:hypothetical protein